MHHSTTLSNPNLVSESCLSGECKPVGVDKPLYDCTPKNRTILIPPGQQVDFAKSNTATAKVQGDDGNVVIYGQQGAPWSSYTRGKCPNGGLYSLTFGYDGILALYCTEQDAGNLRNAIWSSTPRSGMENSCRDSKDCMLVLQPDCNWVIYTSVDCQDPAHPKLLGDVTWSAQDIPEHWHGERCNPSTV